MISEKDAQELQDYLSIFSEQIYCMSTGRGTDRIVWTPMALMYPFTVVTERGGNRKTSLWTTLDDAIEAVNTTL
jgi:hypothetical protein